MGKFLVLLCFALLSMTLVMACTPRGAFCTSDSECCPPFGCMQVNPWIPSRRKCIGFNWGQQGQWGQEGQWGQGWPWGQGGQGWPWGQGGQGWPWRQGGQWGQWGQEGPWESGDSGAADLTVKEPTEQSNK
ncbi:neuropeptide-like protein 32 [Solenopsis invicta]|uniref:neuropeptide-like protein 32 n=1 Tax=Solenopsis invicta TaxID=13686 RepID=UPI000595EC2E|nr:neuropeptide-like protein 32 [Solenopsis invicta]